MAAIVSLLLLCVCSYFISIYNAQETISLVPALYIFGDSTVDGGNKLPSGTPYGIDLNTTAPIRWTNGETIADFVAIFLGLPLVPPYIDMSQAGISRMGVNYAFAGCGIMPQTGQNGWSLDGQIEKFNSTLKNNLTKMLSDPDLLQHLKHSIFLFSFGINDYVRLYLPKNSGTLSKLPPDAFAQFLQNELSVGLTTLYGWGARKFLVNNIWPLGCTPWYANASDPLAICCNETINQLVRPYNKKLPVMLKELQSKLSGAVFSHSNDFEFVEDLKENPTNYGITNTTGECHSTSTDFLCSNRDQYLYFDYLHTTQAANHVFSLNCFNGTLCSPLNIIQLVGALV
ncbi:GDSL esterase/lipase [Camellia lanceoleosa]|uniref:GDSL esterase/lipase n=1 Tax=Camellia lanceoleosa TaxID=1840588 RepID=A0ACC0FZC0_9ERIC|nr:GDSL esterase/lipase [Camellia lanceoleosa]